MDRMTLNTIITATVPVSMLALGVAFYSDVDAPKPAQSNNLERSEVRQIVRDELSQAGLTGDTLDATMEKAIVNFIKSRATEPGNNAAPPKPTAQPQAAENVDIDPIDPSSEPLAGNEDSRYQLIVYSDYECPYCQRFDPTVKTVIEEYGADLAVTMRDYPLPFHGETAMEEAVAAQCAFQLGGNEAFWPYSHGIFDRTNSNGSGLGDGGLVELAVDVGLEKDAFTTCLANDEDIRAGIQEDMASGDAIGVRGTPTSVILDTETGSTAMIRGAQPLSAVTSSLDNLLGSSQ